MRIRAPLALLIPILIGACADPDPTMPADDAAPTRADAPQALAVAWPLDISGTWSDVVEHVSMVVKPGDAVLRLSCVSSGQMEIVQDGATFTGTLHHSESTCQLPDGSAFPPPWPNPYDATFSGTITGRALHIDQYDAPPAYPTHCPKNGTIEEAGGTATGLTTVGTCDLSHLPFPAHASNRLTAAR
jgi:hypothetical protein